MTTHTRVRGLRLRRRSIAALSILVSAAAPAVAYAATQASGGVAAAPAAATSPAATTAAAATIRASARHHNLSGRAIPVTGSLSSGQRGVPLIVQVAKGRHWHQVARTRTGARGRFAAHWRPARVGSYKLRVRAARPGIAPRAIRGRVTVYRAVAASYYGPGLYGSRLACGGTLTPSRLGVANKTLPCGTKVSLRYGGHTVTVPVIDRGPYAGNRVYDLTEATKSRLGFGSTGTVWSSK